MAKRWTRASLLTVALSASLAALAAGCGNATNGTNSTTNVSTGQTPVDGGQLVFGQGTKFDDQLIPDMDASLYTANIVQYAYDPLLTIDKNLNFVPDLVKSYTWSTDKKTITMTLADANWSDGQPITSDDVLFTIDYLASKDYNTTLQGQYGYLVSAIKGAADINDGKKHSFAETGGFTRVDDKTFQLHFDTVDAAVLYSMLSSIQPIPKHALASIPIKDWGTSDFNKLPKVVSGPYTFVQVNGQDSVEMAANPKYFQGKPHISKVIFKTVSPDVAPGLLANGTIDFMLNGLKPQDVSKLKGLSGIQVKTPLQNGFSYLGLKLYQKEFQDVRVRQAFEYGINRQQIVDGILKGLGTPAAGPLPPVSWAAATEQDGMNTYAYNLDKANQLLDEAGWTKGPDGLRIDPVTGKTADLHLDYSSGDPTTQAVAVAIQQDLAKLGVKVTLDAPMDFNTLAKKVESDDKSLQMWIMGWSLSIDPDPRGLWQSSDAFNFPRWKDAHNDALIKDTFSAQAFDQSYRKQAFVKWQLYVNQQLPYVFLYTRDEVFAYNQRVHIPDKDWSSVGPLNIQDWWVTQ